MFKNYLKIAWRNLIKKKIFSVVNILGLALGITSVCLILLWAEDETDYDCIFPKQDLIYLVPVNHNFDEGIATFYDTPRPLAKDLKNEIPEIEKASTAFNSEVLIAKGETRINRTGSFVDPDFLDIFSLRFVEGNAGNALDRPDAIVLTQETANALFGETVSVVGEVIRIDNKHNFTVTGVVADLPQNVTFGFDWLLPFESYGWGEEDVSWMGNYAANFAYTFVELASNSDFKLVDAKVRAMIPSKLDAKENNADTYAFLHSIKDWHLRSEFRDGKIVGGQITFVRLMLWIAAIILIIGCINFINLSTAQSEKRGKEVGVRKVLGSHKKSLISQYMVEALLIAGIASILSVFLVMIALPFFNTLVEKQLSLQLYKPIHLLSLLGITLVCGLLAGWYPSFYLSSFKPAQILKGVKRKKGGSAHIRKGLVITQFTVSLVFIVATLVIYKQAVHAKSRDMGYNKENLVDIPIAGDMIRSFDPIKEGLMDSGSVEMVALSNQRILESGGNATGLTWQGATDTEDILIRHRYVTPNFFEAMGLTLLEGHGFNENSAVDSTNTIITQSFAKLMGKGSPLGKTIDRWGNRFNVIGVVNDYRYGNVYELNNNKPAMFFNNRNRATHMYVRTKSGIAVSQTLADIEQVLKKYNPAFPFEYQFEDQLFNARFKGLHVMGILANTFSILAICIACLGILGLATFTAEQRTKEIGIRKVLGASVSGIVQMLSKDFLKPVLIAMCIAFPLAYWFMSDWLRDFAYRVNLDWMVFAISGCIVLGIALFTASFHAIGAARANPVKSLRSE